jgi:hypothetical protein
MQTPPNAKAEAAGAACKNVNAPKTRILAPASFRRWFGKLWL